MTRKKKIIGETCSVVEYFIEINTGIIWFIRKGPKKVIFRERNKKKSENNA